MVADPFRSEHLLYRAPEDEDVDFLAIVNSDGSGYLNSSAANASLPGKKSAKRYVEYLQKAVVSTIICLPPPADPVGEAKTSERPAPIPIGVIHLDEIRPALGHHRHTTIGLQIIAEYQGRGYGSEAICWITDWAFRRLAMHKVQIGAFGYNEGACRLYRRLGFKEEGRLREFWFHDGRFWDDLLQFGVLESEWNEARGRQKQS